jgi:hypothetical protein
MAIGVGHAIIISVKNLPPVVFDDSIGTNMGVALTFNPLINDFDQDTFPDGNILIDGFDSTSFQNSTISISPDKKLLTYTPITNFFGNDSFTYYVSDGVSTSNIATVNVTVSCLPPITSPKTLNLVASTNYLLDIKNINCEPGAIIFNSGLPDRDVNVPVQNISIITSSVTASPNITIKSITTTTIAFSTEALATGAAFGLSFLSYEIENSTCRFKNTDKASAGGNITSPAARIVQGFLGVTIEERSVPLSFTKYPMFDSVTNEYPLSAVGWFAACFDTKRVPDQFYISTITKPYKNASDIWTTDKAFYGLIGPIGDSLGSTLDGNGRFIFYKPYGYDINLWGKTDTAGSAFDLGCVQIYKPSITDIKNPLRYFSDPATPPTNAEVLACLSDVGKTPFNDTVNDYTSIFTGTAIPSFITVI